MSREELLQLYVMKLEEEANYFKATSPVEEEFCNCPKCQVRKDTRRLSKRGAESLRSCNSSKDICIAEWREIEVCNFC